MDPLLRHGRYALVAALLAVFALPAFTPAQTNLRKIKRGPWRTKGDIPKGWIRHRTRSYEVQSMVGKEKAVRLGKHMETMLRVYKLRFPPGKSPGKRYTIKLLKNRAAFRAYGAPAGAGAYLSPVDKEMVCYDTGKWMDDKKAAAAETGGRAEDDAIDLVAEARKQMERYKMDILGAAAHEGWHQYLHWYVVSWVQLPSWINEGMGDYFYTAQPKKVRGRKVPAELGRLNAMRLPVIQWAVKNNRHVPIKDLLSYTQRDYYSNAGVCYAEGWALCHYLLHSGDKKYAKVIPRFMRFVKNDTNMPAVTKKAFRGIDLDKLEVDWKAWLMEQSLDGKAPQKGDKKGEKKAR